MNASLWDLAGGDSFAPGSGSTSTGTGGVDVPIIVPLPFPGTGTISLPGTVGGVDILNPLAAVSEEFNRKLYAIGLTAGLLVLGAITFAIGLYTIVSE